MAIRPTGYLRKVLSDGEVVLMIVRKHWLVLLGKTLLWMVATVAMFAWAFWSLTMAPEQPTWLWIAIGAVIPLCGWVWEHLVWSNQKHVLTTRRVLAMRGVLNKDVADSLLEKLNDVQTHQSLLGRIFGYGDIEILTASESGANRLSMIANPLGFKRAMIAAKETLQAEHPARVD